MKRKRGFSFAFRLLIRIFAEKYNIYIRAMFIEVVKAEYLDGYRLLLLFNNGEKKIVDLSNSLKGSVYTLLKDTNYFKNFSIKFNTVEWENGADFAPEYLYEIGTVA